MANSTVYPFGPGGELPSGIAVVNDLTTGGVDKALSAEMGKSIGMVTDANVYDFSIADEDGRDIMRLKDGHVFTKKFGSQKPGTVVVAKSGGDFKTISAAVAGTNDGDTILVYPGTYEETVRMWGLNRNIIGVCRETCILTNGTGAYATPPMEANIGSVENMTIIADNYDPTIDDPSISQTSGSYGIHIEYPNSTPYTFTVRNCKIVSKWSAGIGLGLRWNQTVVIDNCELVSECVSMWSTYTSQRVEMGALFFHNDAGESIAGTGRIIVSNTRLTGKKAALILESVENNHPAIAEAEFLNCTLKSVDYGVTSSVIYRWPGSVTPSGYLCGSRITLAESSHGNNQADLNA